MSDEALRRAALEYHAAPRPGKIGTHVFKPAESSRDLSLAYSPGVAEPVLAIAADAEAAASVFEAGFKDVLMVPLDATHKALVTAKECAAFGELGTPAGMATETVIKRRIGSYESSQKMDVPESAPVHDALCVAALVEPDIITTKRCHVAVETTGTLTLGRTVVDTHHRGGKEPNADVAFDANAPRFIALMMEIFGQR